MPFKKVLLTGASGFVGTTMSRALLARGCQVYGMQRGGGTTLPSGVTPLSADLADPASLVDLPHAWDAVIHLAGASVPSLFSTAAPVAYNVQTTLNLLDHLQSGRVLLVSSCHVYAPSLQPRSEAAPVLPQGRYGLSKHLIEQLAPHYRQRLDIRVARPFNHLGPGQRAELVIPSLLRRLAAAPHDTSPVLMQGMNSTRDFIDVQDVVDAYLAILELDRDEKFTFNVCTGRGHTIEELVREVLRQLGSRREVVFQGRPNSSDDNPVLVGDPSRLAAVGWTARVGLAQSLSSMLAHTPTEP
jgi:GDP-4-dehydro-6-deoxy-D-mannose reductase